MTPQTPNSSRAGARRTGLVAAFLTSLSLLPGVSAQETAAAQTPSDVITLSTFQVTTTSDRGYRAGNSVSATRIDTPIKDLPFSISAFTEQFIEDIGALELLDVVNYAPGVTSGAKEFTQGNNRYSIRGFDGDVPPQRNGFVGARYVDAGNIARVEVVKGPASLLYGQITPGGTVNYITKRPTEKSFVRVKQQVGTDEFWRTDVDLNQVVAGGRLGLRLVGAYENTLAWANPSGGDSHLLAGAARWRLTDRATLVVDFESYGRQQRPLVSMAPNMAVPITATAGNFPNLAARARAQAYIDVGNLNLGFLGYPPLPDDFNYPGRNDYRNSDFDSISAELHVALGRHWHARANFSWGQFYISNKLTGLAEFTITPTAAYHGPTGPSRWDYLSELRANPGAVLADPTKTASALLTRRKRLEESFGDSRSYQVELAGRIELGDITLKPLFGAFLTDVNGGSFRKESNTAPAAGVPNSATNGSTHFQPWNYNDRATWDWAADYSVNDIPASRINSFNETAGEDKALYALLTASLFEDRLILIGGARRNETWSQNTNFLPTVATPAAPATVGDPYEARKTTPQFGAGFKLRPDVLLFASYSESFYIEDRSLTSFNPAYNPSVPSGPSNRVTISEPALPVTGSGYEFGVKTDLWEGRVSSTISFFHVERENRVLRFRETAPDGTFPTITRQGTVDESEGVELEVTWSPLDNLQVFATYTRMDVKTTQGTFPAIITYSTDPAVQAAYVSAYQEARSLILDAVPEGSAEELASLWARYNFTGGLKGWWVGGGLVHTGDKAQRTANPTLFLPASTIYDLTVGRDWRRGEVAWSAALSAKNLDDTVYYNANQSRGTPGRLILSLGARF